MMIDEMTKREDCCDTEGFYTDEEENQATILDTVSIKLALDTSDFDAKLDRAIAKLQKLIELQELIEVKQGQTKTFDSMDELIEDLKGDNND
jgi:hypothetical protein